MKIQLKNFRCHKQKTFEIPDYGLYIISGPSGKGKSTLLSAICCGLYGKNPEKKKIYTHGTTTCSIILTFRNIHIERTFNPNTLKVTLNNKTYCDNNAQHIINEYMNVGYDRFIASCYNLQKNPVSLISMTPSNQLSFIENIVSEDKYSIEVKERIKKEIKKLETQEISFKSKIEILNEELDKENSKLNLENENLEDENQLFSSDLIEDQKLNSISLNETELAKTIESLKQQLKEKNKELENKRLELSIQKSKQQEINITKEKINRYSTEIDICKKDRDKITLLDEATIQKKTIKKDKLLLEIEKAKLYFSCLEEEESFNQSLQKHNNEIKQQKINLNKNILSQESIDKYMKTLDELKSNEEIHETISNQILKIKENKDEAIKNLKEIFTKIRKMYSESKIKKCTKTNSMIEELNKKLINLIDEIKSASTILICPYCSGECKLIDNKLIVNSHESPIQINKKEKSTEDRLPEVNFKGNKLSNTKKQSLSELLLEKSTIEEFIVKINNEKNVITFPLPSLPNFNKKENLEEITKITDILKKHETSKSKYDILEDFPEIFKSLQFKLNEKKKNLGNFTITKPDFDKLQNKVNNLSEILSSHKSDKKKKGELNSRIKNNEELLSVIKEGKSHLEINAKLMEDIDNEIKLILNDTIMINSNISSLDNQLNNIKKTNQIKKQRENFNDLLNKRKQYENSLKKIKSTLQCCYKLNDLIKKAEITSLAKILNRINSHSKLYLKEFFEDSISARIQNKKETKGTQKGKKQQFPIKTIINYKGAEYNSVEELSGGEEQRCNLAFLLGLHDMFGCKILFLDECLNNLDETINMNVLSHLKNVTNDKLILVVSHEAIEGVFHGKIDITNTESNINTSNIDGNMIS